MELGDAQLAARMFNDYGPLMRLGRVDEAERILRACRSAFEADGHVANLAMVLGGYAGLEEVRGNYVEAAAFEEQALRWVYLTNDVQSIALHHLGIGRYLDDEDERSLAHLLASAYLFDVIGGSSPSLGHAADALLGSPATSFGDLDSLIDVVDQVEGVKFTELTSRLPIRSETVADDWLRFRAIVVREGTNRLVAAARRSMRGGDAHPRDDVGSVDTDEDVSDQFAIVVEHLRNGSEPGEAEIERLTDEERTVFDLFVGRLPERADE